MRNARNTLSIKMDEATREEKVVDNSDYSGIYAIVAKRNSDNFYYYLTCECSNSRLVAQNAGNTLPYDNISLYASKLWNVVKSEDGTYTIQSYGTDPAQYISWTSGNTALMGNEGLKFEVSINDDKTYCLKNGDRWLSLNSSIGNDYFAMYAGTQTKNLYLIPAVEGEETLPELSSISVSGQTTTFIKGATFVFDGTVTATYSNGITKDVTEDVVVTILANDLSNTGEVDVTVFYTENDITVKASYQINVVSNDNAQYYVKVKSEPDNSDWSGTYLIVCETARKVLSGISTSSTKYGLGENVNIIDEQILASSISEDYKVIISETTTSNSESAYLLTFGGNYLSWTSGNSLKTGTEDNDYNKWNLSVDNNGNVTIKNCADKTRTIRWNNSSPRFACYTSGQTAIQLYKLSE